jgi:hypothetical protein
MQHRGYAEFSLRNLIIPVLPSHLLFLSYSFLLSSPFKNSSSLKMPRSNFKVIIVGGSVAGLTLAHMFEKANINYTILEARDTISPQLGASIVIMPNGARILDQLGVFEIMRGDFVTRMAKSYTRRSDGRLVTSNEWPKIVEEK